MTTRTLLDELLAVVVSSVVAEYRVYEAHYIINILHQGDRLLTRLRIRLGVVILNTPNIISISRPSEDGREPFAEGRSY